MPELGLLVVLGIALAAVVAFVTEWISADVVALLIVVSLGATGVLTVEEALSGFSSPATLTVLAMFVLSAGVYKTGLVNVLANRLHRLGAKGEAKVILAISLLVGPISAFVNNTAAVAILVPLVVALAAEAKRAPSRYLIPLSYASQMGGVLTLIGTSTNILVSDISSRVGHRPLGLFEFTLPGLVVLAVGLVYLTLIAPRLLPHRGRADEEYQPHFVATVVIPETSSSIGLAATSRDAELRLGGRVTLVRRAGHALEPREAELQAGDHVEIEGSPHAMLHAEASPRFLPLGTRRFRQGLPIEEGYTVIEVVVAPSSTFIGPESHLSRLHQADAYVIGLHRRDRVPRVSLGPVTFGPSIDAGDTLLIMARKDRLDELRDDPDLIVVQEVPLVEFKRDKIPHVVGVFLGVVGLAVMDVAPIVVTALAGAAAIVLLGVLDMREFYRSVRWDVVVLLAGLVPLGTALVKTGGADIAAGFITNLGGGMPPWALLLVIYVATALLTEIMSNNGAAVLVVPVAIGVARSVSLDPTPFVLAVAFAASTSFMTPVGYQTNTMVYGPGGYRFGDFFRVGAPLNLLLAGVTTATLATLYGLV